MSRIEAADRDELERLVRDRNTAQKVVWRARIVLLAAAAGPFVWTKSAGKILKKVARAKQPSESQY